MCLKYINVASKRGLMCLTYINVSSLCASRVATSHPNGKRVPMGTNLVCILHSNVSSKRFGVPHVYPELARRAQDKPLGLAERAKRCE